MQPLISVIIPVYNAERFLYECVYSVINQTYSNLEIILVDDGSPDHCPDICDDFAEKDKRVKVFHKDNGGVSSARNMGLDLAKGDYIVFLDADDTLKVDALEKLYFALTDHGCDISIGWKTCVTEDGKELGCPYKTESAIWEGTEGLENSLKDHPACYAVWGKLYKSSVINNIRFVEGKKVHEDSFFFFQCLTKQPRVCLCDLIVLNYTESENSASRAVFSDKFLDILYFADEKKKIIDDSFPGLTKLADNMVVKANLALLTVLLKNRDRKYKKIENGCIKRVIACREHYIPMPQISNRMYYIVIRRVYKIYKLLYCVKQRLNKNY